MRAIITDRSGYAVRTALEMTPESMSWGRGGPLQATLAISGPPDEHWELRRWLGYYCTITDTMGDPIWWGMVTATKIVWGSLQVSYSLDDMANTVAVAYTEDGERYTTEWVTDGRSVDRYGTKELLYSRGDLTQDEAEAKRAEILRKLSKPVPSPAATRSDASILSCDGFYSLLDWTYYKDEAGRILFDEGTKNAVQPVGWGIVGSADIGFTAGRKLHDGLGRLSTLSGGMVLKVAGSSSNNGELTVEGSATGTEEAYSYEADTISFDPSDDIADSATGLGEFRNDALIKISGSSSNSGYHLLDSVGRGSLTTDTAYGGTVALEAAGPTITITQGQELYVEEDLTKEMPGSSVTLTLHGERVAQSFEVPAGDGLLLGEIWVKVGIVGSPSDNLNVAIYSDSGGSPSLLQEQISVAGGNLGDTEWVRFDADHTTSLTAGATYWVVVWRSGANSYANYYEIDLDEDAGYGEAMKVYDGSAWVARWTDASMLFQVWGHTLTSDLMQRIVEEEGQYIADVSMRTGTGLYTRSYRDGDSTALDELESLIETGTSTGDTLWPWVNQSRRLIIDKRPLRTQVSGRLLRDGTVTDVTGQPLLPGHLPVGKWIEVDGAPMDSDGVAPLSPFFCDSAEWEAGSVRLRAEGAPNPWNLSGTRQG